MWFPRQEIFSLENIPNLLPKDLDRSVLDKVVFFHRKISRIPIGAISMGSFVHTDLCSNPKPPFIGLTRSSFLRKMQNIAKQFYWIQHWYFFACRKLFENKFCSRTVCQCESHPCGEPTKKGTVSREETSDLHQSWGVHGSCQCSRFGSIRNWSWTRKEWWDSELWLWVCGTSAMNSILDLTNTWLCCEQITIADISLAVLMQRLYSLGFEEYFWMQKRPHLRQYFSRISARESFQKSLPTTFSTVRAVWTNTPWMYKAGGWDSFLCYSLIQSKIQILIFIPTVAALSATIVISSIIVKT